MSAAKRRSPRLPFARFSPGLRSPLRRGGEGARRRLPLLAGLLVVLGVVAAGCANGTYPLDLFYEMHYQQSFGAHEPPRLTVPEGAVPVTGKELFGTENPIPPGERLEEGARLYATNCAFCHGATGKGDNPELQGPVLRIMREKYNYPQSNPTKDYTITPDLTADFVKDQADVGYLPGSPTV